MRIGLVTAGGDCPGLNAVIRAVVRRGVLRYGHEFVGFAEGWRGMVENIQIPVDLAAVERILHQGGTILRSSRLDVRKVPDGFERCAETMKREGVDAIIAIGGNGTQAANVILTQLGLNCVGVPKTIDNDLNGTDTCFGFDTAVGIATEAIDRLHSTAEAHRRVMVCEVMGRHVGWIAAYAGLASGAHITLVPEMPVNLDAITQQVQYEWEHGRQYAIVVVAEGVRMPGSDRTKLSGVGAELAEELERRTGYETRSVTLGHVLRGGTPSAYDRILATRFGTAAIDLVDQKKFGRMVALHAGRVVDIPLVQAVSSVRRLSHEMIQALEAAQTARQN
jgi:ATP-dependent phosphofructokinase / diphosphate-dependent phosphofructokinase